MLAVVCLVEFTYLYVTMEVKQSRPLIPVLGVFGIIGAVGMGAGLGTLVTFLGLGIIDNLDHKGKTPNATRSIH